MRARNATAGTSSSALCKEIAVQRELFTKQPCQTTKHTLATDTFKKRYYNHKSSFQNERYKNSPALSTYIWENQINTADIHWSIVVNAEPYKAGQNTCALCLAEKFWNPESQWNSQPEQTKWNRTPVCSFQETPIGQSETTLSKPVEGANEDAAPPTPSHTSLERCCNTPLNGVQHTKIRKSHFTLWGGPGRNGP